MIFSGIFSVWVEMNFYNTMRKVRAKTYSIFSLPWFEKWGKAQVSVFSQLNPWETEVTLILNCKSVKFKGSRFSSVSLWKWPPWSGLWRILCFPCESWVHQCPVEGTAFRIWVHSVTVTSLFLSVEWEWRGHLPFPGGGETLWARCGTVLRAP